MAKIKYGQDLNDGLEDFIGNLELTVKGSGKIATWVDDESGAKIVVEGKNLAESEEQPDILGDGKINSVEITDGDKKLVVSFDGLDLKAVKVMQVFQLQGSEGLAFYLSKGDDMVVGSGKSDLILGAAGDDVMTGKGGSDHFYFQGPSEETRAAAKPEHDVITDFDVKGKDADGLYYFGEYTHKGVHGGDDTQLKFEDGSTLVLEGVKVGQFEHYLETQMG